MTPVLLNGPRGKRRPRRAPHHVPSRRRVRGANGRRASPTGERRRWPLIGRGGQAGALRPSPAAQRRPLQALAPRAGTGGRRRSGPGACGLHIAGRKSRSARPGRSPTQAGGGHSPGALRPGTLHANLPHPAAPSRGPRSPEDGRVSSLPHVASGQPAASTCLGKPRSSCPPIGSLGGRARLRPLLIGR